MRDCCTANEENLALPIVGCIVREFIRKQLFITSQKNDFILCSLSVFAVSTNVDNYGNHTRAFVSYLNVLSHSSLHLVSIVTKNKTVIGIPAQTITRYSV